MKKIEEIMQAIGISPDKSISELSQDEAISILNAFCSDILNLEGKTVEELEELLEKYESELGSLEDEEPEDPDSEEYEEWEEKIEELQDIIDEITEAIENLEEESDEDCEDGLNITITLKPGEDVSEKISILKSLLKTEKKEE